MARTGITKNDVFTAAHHIIGRGLVPTNELIRNHLGTGSNSTIAAYFREWKALQKQTSQYVKNTLPPEVIGLLNGVWERLYGLAQEEGEAAKAVVDQQMDELATELNTLKESYQRQVEVNDKLNSTADTLQACIDQQAQAIDAYSRDQVIFQQQLHDKNLLITELKQINQRLQGNLEHFHESARIQRQEEQAQHVEQLQAEQHSRKATEQQLQTVQFDYQQLVYKHEEKFKELDKINHGYHLTLSNLEAVTNMHEQLKKTYQQIEMNSQHWQQQHQLLESKYLDSAQQISLLEKERAVINHQLTELNNEMQSLKDINQQFAYERLEMLQENARLVGINQQSQSMLEKGMA